MWHSASGKTSIPVYHQLNPTTWAPQPTLTTVSRSSANPASAAMPPQILPQSIGTIFRTRKPPLLRQQVRHATLIKRHKRPYTFTQLVTLSDGSAFLHRTTSPAPIHRSNKDVRNSIMWNPSSKKLLNVEEDEAGRLRAFRARFGRGWDAAATPEEGEMERAQSVCFSQHTASDGRMSSPGLRCLKLLLTDSYYRTPGRRKIRIV